MAPKPVEDDDEALHAFVNGHKDLEWKDDSMGKVRVKSTGHEMPSKLHLVKEYLNGQKYKKHHAMYCNDFSKYLPYIAKHEHQEKFLFCKLTKSVLPMDPIKVEKHVNSSRYKEAVAEMEQRGKDKEAKEQQKYALRTKLRLEREKAQAEGGAGTAGAAGKKPGKKLKRKREASAGAAAGEDAQAKAAKAPLKKKKRPDRAMQGLRKKQTAVGKFARKQVDAAAASAGATGGDAPKQAPAASQAGAGDKVKKPKHKKTKTA